jgi:hypothetical protein
MYCSLRFIMHLQGDNMQRYLNIDPMDGAAGLQEGSGLLGQLPGMDDEPPSMPTPVSGLGGVNAGAGAGAGVFSPQAGIQPSIASTRVPAFTSSNTVGGGSAVAMTTPVSSGAGYVPPSNPFGSPDGGGSAGYELSETTSNPLASRYPAPTISAAGAGAGGAAGAGPSTAPAGRVRQQVQEGHEGAQVHALQHITPEPSWAWTEDRSVATWVFVVICTTKRVEQYGASYKEL